jgi:hypothetical protein
MATPLVAKASNSVRRNKLSRIALSGNPLGTGTFTLASPNSNSDRTLTLPDNSGTVLTTATPGVPVNGPAFFANGATGASLAAGTNTKVAAFSSAVFDTNSNFDTSNSRFTPTVAGYYQISASVRSNTSLTVLHATLYKNGAAYAAGNFRSLASATANNASTVSALVYLNGSTDYVEMYAFVNATATTDTSAGQTWFSGVLVRAA